MATSIEQKFWKSDVIQEEIEQIIINLDSYPMTKCQIRLMMMKQRIMNGLNYIHVCMFHFKLLILFNFHHGDPSDQMFFGEAIKLG